MVRSVSKISIFLLFLCVGLAPAQQGKSPTPRSQEVSEEDGIPVLIKHLPDWQNVRTSTVFITDPNGLKATLGDRPVLDKIEFTPGTEAVKADYPSGKLLIVEFTNPQGSIETDAKVLQHLTTSPDAGTVYRRIGNYNVFVFDAADQDAATALLEQVKYEKAVQWLGEDPFLISRLERYFVTTTRDIFISTVLWIVGGIGFALICGVLAGIIFFKIREQRRAEWQTYSDAGGLTRLNLDELSE